MHSLKSDRSAILSSIRNHLYSKYYSDYHAPNLVKTNPVDQFSNIMPEIVKNISQKSVPETVTQLAEPNNTPIQDVYV